MQRNHGESTSLTMIAPRLCTTNAIGCYQAFRNCSKLTNCRHRTLLPISLSRLTDRLITKSAAWCVLVVASKAEIFTTVVTAYDCITKSFSDDRTLDSPEWCSRQRPDTLSSWGRSWAAENQSYFCDDAQYFRDSRLEHIFFSQKNSRCG